jgi:uncharacterized protein YdaU (DUF1376 family)
MTDLPVMPVYVQRLLVDTNHLSDAAFGVYCRLLFTMWLRGGRLPNNEQQLARIGGVTVRVWRTLSPALMAFFIDANGELSQKRLTATLIEVQELKAKRAAAAKKRWYGNTDAKH